VKGQDLDKQRAFGGSLCCFGGQKNDERRWKYDGKGHLIRERSHIALALNTAHRMNF